MDIYYASIAQHIIIYIGVKRHTLHYNHDFAWATHPIENGIGVDPIHLVYL